MTPNVPDDDRGSRRGRRLVIVGGVVVTLVVAALVVKQVWLTDSSRTVPVSEALDDFRNESIPPTESLAPTTPPQATPTTTEVVASTTAPETSAPTTEPPPTEPATLPDPGVYVYATTGGESIDAMGGVDRTYPAETTIIVVPRGCGVQLEWIALDERREEWTLCPTDTGVALQADAAQFHEWFDMAQRDEVRCDATVEVVTFDGSVPPPVSPVCTLADDPWTPVWTVIGREIQAVEGVDLGVTRVRMTVDDSDEFWETTAIDWLLTDSGLPVVVEATTTSRSPSIVGPVVYEESYRLELRSLTPLT